MWSLLSNTMVSLFLPSSSSPKSPFRTTPQRVSCRVLTAVTKKARLRRTVPTTARKRWVGARERRTHRISVSIATSSFTTAPALPEIHLRSSPSAWQPPHSPSLRRVAHGRSCGHFVRFQTVGEISGHVIFNCRIPTISPL